MEPFQNCPKLNATGFVSAQAGSVASANAMLIREILRRGINIDFFTKPSFVDPSSAVNDLPEKDKLQLVDCTNHLGDGLRKRMAGNGSGIWSRVWTSIDAKTYNQGLVRRMRKHPSGEVDLWFGDWAHGQGSRPVVTFAQGPPGTDARSVLRNRSLIQQLAGKRFSWSLALFARYRLSWGLPNFRFSDIVIVGSHWSRLYLEEVYQVPLENSRAIPYPVDLKMFRPLGNSRSTAGPLKLLWLGRFAPRKRLDVFLDGLASAIRAGCDAQATIVGRSDFVPNYERLIADFQFPSRVRHIDQLPRTSVPEVMWENDVLCQPSDEENFGSSVAEALACGIPAIVGATNGTCDYICERSIKLANNRTTEMASAIERMAELKRKGALADPRPSRLKAEQFFDVIAITDQLLDAIVLAKQRQ